MGAGSPANTGAAGAIHCGVFFAGKPAPTGIALYSRLVKYL
ncbi:diguanylate cyclase [Pseudomonas plecoglossicida]|uniref:Diguanylate cyclase n=1 Tax=Pseudomonas plecoglossicida TaxID=70775 RepID=A0A2A3M294_PSEDL|nr:diguanylate cyclase [Pseudomonas plecoglossicida]